MSFDPMFVLFAFFAAVVGFMLFRTLQYGGLKAAMFGAPIGATVGEVECTGSRLTRITIKIHRLGGGDSERAVGLELAVRSPGGYEMTPATLSPSEVRTLVKLLEAAIDNK